MGKRTKAIKIGDIKEQKPWLKRTGSKYVIERVERNKTILIVCEGQTEKYYFEGFPKLGITTKVINLEGQSKLTLVARTKKLQREENCDFVWCVFDMDINHGEIEFSQFDNAIHSAKQMKFSVAYSNDSFELWLYLHYQNLEVNCRRDYLYDKLSGPLNIDYVKEGKKKEFCQGLYKLLENDPAASQELAIKRARTLHETSEHLPYHEQNPVTVVYELVEFLNENLTGRS
ncbi:RloB family protein [Dyadobacter alkalitolerans]|uniref:RloB family protein n=1 Tax=Dyadobacter alkalitolerans TaxID=492736 RepID=UPI000479236F|nr:RloB family protein [Dyadobacter alkalitolerans]